MNNDLMNVGLAATKLRRGYEEGEVDNLLDQVIVELRRLTAENDTLRELIPPDAQDKIAAASASAEKAEEAAAARIAQANADAEQAEAEATERARAATEAAKGIARSAFAVGEDGRGEVEVDGAATEGLDPAVGVLALAQKLHDEYVSVGEAKHDALVVEADALIAKATAEHERIISEARERSTGMVAAARQKRTEVFQKLDGERGVLQEELEELRTHNREFRAHLKSYFEDQLNLLEKNGTDKIG
ncbi:MAG: DivIVA domain-containing protein [Actinomycetes bacterium]